MGVSFSSVSSIHPIHVHRCFHCYVPSNPSLTSSNREGSAVSYFKLRSRQCFYRQHRRVDISYSGSKSKSICCHRIGSYYSTFDTILIFVLPLSLLHAKS